MSTRQLELQVVQLTNALGVLLGHSPKALVDEAISVAGVSLPASVQLPAALPSSVLTQRPDIGAAEAALNASAADIGVARAQLFPSISITGAFGWASPELDDLFTGPAKIWSATGGILQPIFQGGRLRANVSRAEAVREQRKSEYASTVQQAFREVLDSLQGQTLIAGVREANDQQVAALEPCHGAGGAALRAGRYCLSGTARCAPRVVSGADRSGRGSARRVAQHD